MSKLHSFKDAVLTPNEQESTQGETASFNFSAWKTAKTSESSKSTKSNGNYSFNCNCLFNGNYAFNGNCWFGGNYKSHSGQVYTISTNHTDGTATKTVTVTKTSTETA